MAGRRRLSPVQIYHVMGRGVKKYDLFLDSKDYKSFLSILRKKTEEKEFLLHSFCFMSNHYHLLLEESEKALPLIMQGINSSYARRFNQRHKSAGHVFQGRYASEAISSETGLIRCARYIHNNPVKAGLVTKAESYPWSSYRSYILGKPEAALFKDLLLNCHSSCPREAISEVKAYTSQDNDDSFLDYDNYMPGKEERFRQVRSEIDKILAGYNLTLLQLQEFEGEKKYAIIRDIKQRTKASVRQLGKVLGISKSTIYRA